MIKFLPIRIFTTALPYLLTLFSVALQAQNLAFKGNISDIETGMPLEFVVVTMDQSNNHTHTDNNGNFFFVNLTPGIYTLFFEKTGYDTQRLKIELSGTDTINLNVLMVSKAISLNEVAIQTDKPVSAASSAYLSQINFENRPRNSAQDLLRLVPGLFIAQHAGGGKAEQIFIRGFDCDHGTDVATFVDGIPVNMPSHGHGQGYADLHFLTPEIVEGMSIFKGTSSPYYGDFATGAAVGFKTYDSLPNNLIQLEAGSAPRTNAVTSSRALAMLKVPFNSNKISSYFSIDDINNRGYFDRSQNFKRLNLFSKTTYYINDHSKLQFSASGFGSSWDASGQIPERAVAEGLINRFGSIDPHEGGTTQRNNYNLSFNSKLGNGEFETQVYTCTYRFKLFSDFTFLLNDPVNGDMIEQDDNRTVRGMNAKYTMPHDLFGLKNKITIGTSFRSDDIDNQLWHAPARERLSVTAHSLIHERSSSAYINEVFRFSEQFRIEAGLRYDYFIFDVEDQLPNDTAHKNYSGYNYQSALNPKLNMIYSANSRTQFFFNTGSGFHSNDARAVVQDNSHQLPLAISAELGTLLHVGKAVISAAVWEMELSNELVFTGDDGTTEDKGASRRMGVDLSGRMQLLPWLFADVDVNYARGRLVNKIYGNELSTGNRIPLAPVLTSAGGFTFKFAKGFEGSLRYRYMKDRPANEDNTVIAHGYNVVDMALNYRVKHYKFGVIIENLLNVKWNEAQFDTETRLRGEAQSTSELSYTPGTPFYAKLVVSYTF